MIEVFMLLRRLAGNDRRETVELRGDILVQVLKIVGYFDDLLCDSL